MSFSNDLVDAGEKMGLQITVLLTMVIYVEVLQSNIPVFDTYGYDLNISSFKLHTWSQYILFYTN